MTTLTQIAERTIVFIVLAMAAHAATGQHELAGNRRVVAVDTAQLLMLAIQLEFGFIVIEVPILPISRVMTRATLHTQGAFMHILLLMT